MSPIASFYTLPAAKMQALVAAAAPRKVPVKKPKLIFFSKTTTELVDQLQPFLQQHAVEQQEYSHSGTGFLDLDLILEQKRKSLFAAALPEVSESIGKACQASVAVFDKAAAQRAIGWLNEVALKPEDITKYYQEDERLEDAAEGVVAVMAAYDLAKKWLASVQDAEIGVLILG